MAKKLPNLQHSEHPTLTHTRKAHALPPGPVPTGYQPPTTHHKYTPSPGQLELLDDPALQQPTHDPNRP